MLYTHTYDGRLSVDTTQPINISFEDAVHDIQKRHPSTAMVCRLILTDRQRNWDPSNHISFEYLLPLVWEHIQNTDLEGVFIEQFLDILRGPCAQGRTTRIYQVWKIYLDVKNNEDTP